MLHEDEGDNLDEEDAGLEDEEDGARLDDDGAGLDDGGAWFEDVGGGAELQEEEEEGLIAGPSAKILMKLTSQ